MNVARSAKLLKVPRRSSVIQLNSLSQYHVTVLQPNFPIIIPWLKMSKLIIVSLSLILETSYLISQKELKNALTPGRSVLLIHDIYSLFWNQNICFPCFLRLHILKKGLHKLPNVDQHMLSYVSKGLLCSEHHQENF